ncbi:MAG: class I SAM-dependent methyltransferase [Nitrospirales bacterium]
MGEVMEYHPTVIANVPCCVCESEKSQEFFNCRFDKFHYSGVFHMRRCSECDLLFCSPRLSEQGIAALYDANYYVFQKKDADSFARTAQIYQRTIGRIPANVPKRVVEVGSGKGYLLSVLHELGWQSYGIEISEHAARYSQEQFGVPTYSGTLDQYLESSNLQEPFPLTLCIDIIEHVPAPEIFVHGLARLTAPGGYLVIDTPNGKAAHIEGEGSLWRGFNPFHIYVFHSENIKKLLSRAGFEIIEVFTYNNFLERRNLHEDSGTFLRRVSQFIKRYASFTNCGVDSNTSCAKMCQRLPNYFQTQDSQGELAPSLRGENLMIVARRA